MNTTRSPLLTLALLAMVLFLVFQLREARHMRVVQKTSPTADARTEPSSRSNRETEATLVYKRVSPSVVAVANSIGAARILLRFPNYECRKALGPASYGTRGHIVSNYHVVHQANRLTVTFGRRSTTRNWWASHRTMTAVLKIDAPPDRLVPVEVVASRDLEVSQRVYAIGNPFGLDTTLSSGIVSALGRTITSMTDRKITT